MECITDDSTTLRVASFACYLDATKENLVHKISAQDTPIVLNSGAKPKPTLSPNVGLANLRVDSFSYLNTSMGDHGFVFNVPKPIHNPSTGFTFPKEIPKDGEISVFGADKYFNAMKLECHDGIKHERKQEPVNLPRIGSTPRNRPSSLCSDSSSLNSRTALLLANSRANGSGDNKHKKTPRRGGGFFFRFGCQGPCFDKKGISIVNNETHSARSNRPMAVQLPSPIRVTQPPELASIDESRTSIEVFGSAMISSKGDVAANLERKLSMLTWDAIPKSKEQAPTVRTSTVCDDMASDASSDLFEIENITGSIYPVLTVSGEPDVDVSNCPSPMSHYAPSEASIQWSVVTASAADYASVLSDYNETEILNTKPQSRNNSTLTTTTTRKNKGVGRPETKGRAGGLLGCKSQKAVDVAENNQYVCYKSSSDQKAKNLPALRV